MPLHLLPKKSYNPYAPAAIAQVRADEAAAAAATKRLDELERSHDAAVRMARMRDEERPPTPPEVRSAREAVAALEAGKGERTGSRGFVVEEKRLQDEKRKRRRLQGEDDTDRDIRLARMAVDRRSGEEDRESGREDKEERVPRKRVRNDAPIVDRAGHIQLFTPASDQRNDRRGPRGRGANGKEDDVPNSTTVDPAQGALRFADAAGFRQSIHEKPWYHTTHGRDGDNPDDTDPVGSGTDAFGRPDPNRTARDAARLQESDPMAMMKNAQRRLKHVERQRLLQKEAQETENDALRDAERRRQKRGGSTARKDHLDDIGPLEGFNLDETPRIMNENNERKRHRSRDDRHERRRHEGERHSRPRRHGEEDHRRDRERHHKRSSSHRYESSRHD